MDGELAAGHDVPHFPPAHTHVVGDDAPVALPPQSLGTHYRRAARGGQFGQFCYCGGEFDRIRIVGV